MLVEDLDNDFSNNRFEASILMDCLLDQCYKGRRHSHGERAKIFQLCRESGKAVKHRR